MGDLGCHIDGYIAVAAHTHVVPESADGTPPEADDDRGREKEHRRHGSRRTSCQSLRCERDFFRSDASDETIRFGRCQGGRPQGPDTGRIGTGRKTARLYLREGGGVRCGCGYEYGG